MQGQLGPAQLHDRDLDTGRRGRILTPSGVHAKHVHKVICLMHVTCPEDDLRRLIVPSLQGRRRRYCVVVSNIVSTCPYQLVITHAFSVASPGDRWRARRGRRAVAISLFLMTIRCYSASSTRHTNTFTSAFIANCDTDSALLASAHRHPEHDQPRYRIGISDCEQRAC